MGRRAAAQIAAIRAHLTTIGDLRARVADLETRLADRPLAHLSGAPLQAAAAPGTPGAAQRPQREPGTPAWIARATAAIERTRAEMQAGVSLAAEAQRLLSQGGPADAARVSTLLARVLSDASLKEELVVQLETAQREAVFMRQKYDERHALAMGRLGAVTAERDEALGLLSASRVCTSRTGGKSLTLFDLAVELLVCIMRSAARRPRDPD